MPYLAKSSTFFPLHFNSWTMKNFLYNGQVHFSGLLDIAAIIDELEQTKKKEFA